MSALRTAAQQALEALAIGQDAAHEVAQTYHEAMAGYRPARHIAVDDDVRKIEDAITALRAALAEPVQEPVAWQERQARRMRDGVVTEWTDWYPCRYRTVDEARSEASDHIPYEWRPLYTAPPQRKPLTEEEIRDLWSWAMTAEAERTATTQQHAFARAVERAHEITP